MNLTVITAGFLSGLIGGMGLGGGAVLIMYLSLYTATPELESQGINLLFFIPIGITATAIYAFKKQIKWKTVLTVCIGGVAGAFFGYNLAGFIGAKYLAKIFGAGILLFGLKEIFAPKEKGVERKQKR
ncbi:MAG: sulfite exporter TauE/SafE family protein [Clostridia bacterium]|nr:sulfite exporter TauE/SafE family protein [Clostridia bacterium]